MGLPRPSRTSHTFPVPEEHWRALLSLGVTLLLVTGCASTAVGLNADATDAYAKEKIGVSAKWQKEEHDRAAARKLALELLENPLSSDGAVRLALTQSPAFQAMLSDAAAMSASATQSARISNPIFTFSWLTRHENGGAELSIERMLSVSLLELIQLPAKLKIADSIQTQVQLRGAASAVDIATTARQAWVRAVAAQQAVAYFEQVKEAAEASAELARRMQAAGNFSKLQQARQQAFYAEAAAQMLRAKQNRVATREALIRTLGLDDTLAVKLTLPEQLPALPDQPKQEATVAQTAMDQRLDVQMAIAELRTIATKNGLTKAASYINVLHLAGRRDSETGKSPQSGYELELSIPLFDWGDARRASAQADYIAALHRVAQTGIDAASSVREQHAAWRAAYDLSNHYRKEIVPLRKAIAGEMLLQYNGMLSSVFDLLAETREQISSVILAIDAQRDFWLADAALRAAVLGRPLFGAKRDGAVITGNGEASH